MIADIVVANDQRNRMTFRGIIGADLSIVNEGS